MAIVVQSDRFIPDKTKASDKIGPGQYEAFQQFKQIKKNKTPFNSSAEKDYKQKKQKKQENPGPGAYDIIYNPYAEKVLINISDEEGQKIMEIPKQNSIFKSQIDRFRHRSEHKQTPGPGSYFKDQSKPIQKEFIKTQTIIQALKDQNEYQNAPSIPGQGFSYGYTENEDRKLILNVPQQEIYSGTKDDRIGPTHYQQIDQFTKNKINDKGAGWSLKKDSKLKPLQNVQTKPEVGPGKYDLNLNHPYQLQQNLSYGFASSTYRIWDQRKGMIANKSIIERAKIQTKIQYDSDNFDETQFEYIDDNTPGPGYYHNESTQSSIKLQPKSEKPFGLNCPRFKNKLNNTIGQNDYKEIQQNKLKQRENNVAPFQTLQRKFDNQVPENIPGPGTYDPKINIVDKQNQKIKLTTCGTFNSKEEKYRRQSDLDEYPGPGQYINPDIIAFQNYQDVIAGKQNCVFQSQISRDLYTRKNDKRPDFNSYDVHNFTVKKRVTVDDNYVKKAPFLTKQKRLECQIKQEKQEEITQTHQISLKEYFSQKNQQNIPFNSNDPRFKHQQEFKNKNKLGPGQYNQNTQTAWKRKTFNILFAEI